MTAADPGQPNARSLVDHPAVVPASVHGAVLLGTSSRPRVFSCARLSMSDCMLPSNALALTTPSPLGKASKQVARPAVWNAVDRNKSRDSLPSAPWFLVGVISAQVIRMWPRAWLVLQVFCVELSQGLAGPAVGRAFYLHSESPLLLPRRREGPWRWCVCGRKRREKKKHRYRKGAQITSSFRASADCHQNTKTNLYEPFREFPKPI